jgi:hypothetical protein
VRALANLLSELSHDKKRLRDFGYSAKKRMDDWGPPQNLAATVEAVAAAVRHRRG